MRSRIARFLVRLGLSRLLRIEDGAIGRRAERPPRELHLASIAQRLEVILGELDDLSLQRISIDVCMALDRVRAQLADRDPVPQGYEGPIGERPSSRTSIADTVRPD